MRSAGPGGECDTAERPAGAAPVARGRQLPRARRQRLGDRAALGRTRARHREPRDRRIWRGEPLLWWTILPVRCWRSTPRSCNSFCSTAGDRAVLGAEPLRAPTRGSTARRAGWAAHPQPGALVPVQATSPTTTSGSTCPARCARAVHSAKLSSALCAASAGLPSSSSTWLYSASTSAFKPSSPRSS